VYGPGPVTRHPAFLVAGALDADREAAEREAEEVDRADAAQAGDGGGAQRRTGDLLASVIRLRASCVETGKQVWPMAIVVSVPSQRAEQLK
jgi:hypothetical protein